MMSEYQELFLYVLLLLVGYLFIFQWRYSKSNKNLSLNDYRTEKQDQRVIDNYIRYGQTEKGLDLIRRNIVKPNAQILNNLLKNFIKEKKINHIKEIYAYMKNDEHCQLNIFNLNNILHSAIECHDFEFFFSIFESIPDLQKDIVTFSTFIKGLLRKNQVKKTQILYTSLKQSKQIKFDVVFYNTIIDGLNKIKEYNYAYEILQDFIQDKNIQNFNNEYTISIIVQLLANLRKFEEAETYAQQLEDKSLIVNTCLIKSYLKLRSFDKIIELCEKSKHLNKDLLFYSTVVNGLNKHHQKIEFCAQLAVESLEKRFFMKSEIYNNILSSLLKNQPQYQTLLRKLNTLIVQNNIRIDRNLPSAINACL